MKDKKEYRFNLLPKPEIENVMEITPDTIEFNEPEKAEALIKSLALSVGDKIRESGENAFIVNPRMVLRGNSPEYYKEQISNLKKILTKEEIEEISKAIKTNTKDYNKKLYDKITKRFDGFYWRNEIKKSLQEEIKQVLEFFKKEVSSGINNTIFHLLCKDKEDFVYCYKCAWKEKPIPDIREWSEKNDGEYMVLTDGEADEMADDYLDEGYWKEAVKSDRTTSSFEDWKEDVIKCDGRGSILSGYDGSEEYEEINGKTYYIYRIN